jgi:hypothetical protein
MTGEERGISMDHLRNSILILFCILILVGSLVGVCSGSSSAGNTSDNLTRVDWTGLRNTNSSIVDNMNLSLSITNPDEEKKVEYITDRVKENINASFSYDSSDVSKIMKNKLYIIIRDPDNGYLGPLARTDNFSVSVFKTTSDPLVSNPSYLSREYIIRYNISFSPGEERSRIEDTILWYEYDATKVVKKLYNSDFGDNIAVAIIDIHNPSGKDHVIFMLNAEDFEKLSPYWDGDEKYIRYYDWSRIIADNAEILFCEDPAAGVDLPFESVLSASKDEFSDMDEDLKTEINDQVFELMKSVDSIRRNVAGANTEGIISSSEALVKDTYNFRQEISEYPYEESVQPLIDEYLAGIDSFSKIGSYYWYNSRSINRILDNESDEYLLEGVDRINNVLGAIGEQEYDPGDLTKKQIKRESYCFSSGEAFHYMDKGGGNDISIKITGYYLKSKLLVKKINEYEYKEAAPGKIYLAVVVDINHLGYRGVGSETVSTPGRDSYRLYYDGYEYQPVSMDYETEDMGEIYKEKSLSRKERYESLLLFEINDLGSFNPKNGYVVVDLGDYGKQLWSLSPNAVDQEYLEGTGEFVNELGWMGEQKLYEADDGEAPSTGELSDHLSAGTAFHYRDKTESNDISIKITNYYLKNRLLLKKSTGTEYQEAEFGKRYIGVVVDIRHLGYRGKGKQQITTPDLNSFVFYYDGKTYAPVNIENYIEDMGEVYSKRTLNRLERFESLLIFEIDKEDTFTPEDAYVEVDLGDYGKRIWQLSSGL